MTRRRKGRQDRRKKKAEMHPKYQRAHKLSSKVIGAGMEVHSALGPGLLESVYEKCLLRELGIQGLSARQQMIVPLE